MLPTSWFGQAPAVILSDNELAELDEAGDPSVTRDRFRSPQVDDEPDARPVSWRSRLVRGAVITALLVAAMLPVAFGLALATRA